METFPFLPESCLSHLAVQFIIPSYCEKKKRIIRFAEDPRIGLKKWSTSKYPLKKSQERSFQNANTLRSQNKLIFIKMLKIFLWTRKNEF